MDIIIELAKLIVPAAIVLYAMYLTVKSFVNKELESKKLDVIARSQEVVLPVRLQAYERVTLFLERISPNNLIIRLNKGPVSAKEFQQQLLAEIRDEYNHNVSQQVYMSTQVWALVKNAKEDLNITINKASEGLAPEASNIDLAKNIFELMMQNEIDPIAHAIDSVKEEIRQSF